MHREDVPLSGSCTIVLYYDGAFWIRLLRRGKPPTYLTKGVEMSTDGVQLLERYIELVRTIPRALPNSFQFGQIILTIHEGKVTARIGESAEGWGDMIELQTALRRLLQAAGLEVKGTL